jgi:SAM-dependent methyltransferase
MTLGTSNEPTAGAVVKKAEQKYIDGTYAKSNPTWHQEVSAWKASKIVKILTRNSIRPCRIADVGCGAGGVLSSLLQQLPPPEPIGLGFDISPYAITKARLLQRTNLTFTCADFLTSGEHRFDLVICIDVFEHVEDYMDFLRRLRARSEFFVFHIPLDMNVKSLLSKWHVQQRRDVGHLHYFDYMTAICSLEETGYQVLDRFYTSIYYRDVRSRLLHAVRWIVRPRRAKTYLCNYLAARR